MPTAVFRNPTHDPGDDPVVSFVVTTYNQAEFIGDAVESALSQTYQRREVIVVDDGSRDNTSSVLERFGDRITVIRQENTGVAGSRNRGVRAATGTLVAFLDGDDRCHPDRLRRQVDAFQRFPDAGLIACNGRQFDGDRVMEDRLFPDTVQKLFAGATKCIRVECLDTLIRENLIYTMSQVMAPRLVLEEIGASDSAFPIASDYDLYLRIAFRYPLVFVDESLTDWRYLRTSASGPSDRRPLRWAEDILAVLRKQSKAAPLEWQPLVRSTLHARTRETARRAYYYGCDLDPKWARVYLWRLLLASRQPIVAMYLCGLLTPQAVRSIVAPTLGKLLNGVASINDGD